MLATVFLARSVGMAQYPYAHGDPTALEQLLLEYVNRARLQPAEEGVRLVNAGTPGHPDAHADIVSAVWFFDVDLAKVRSDFAKIPPTPPLAFHPLLIQAARTHSQDMIARDVQSHSSANGWGPGQRVQATGYLTGASSYTVGENIYAYAEDMRYAHAGFEIDWGNDPPGHRENLHKRGEPLPGYREIGIGVVADNSPGTEVGPLVVTQDLAGRNGSGPFILGAVYEDRDGDNFYTAGEGVAGEGIYRDTGTVVLGATTSTSGGYAFPIGAVGATGVRWREYALAVAHPPWQNRKVDVQILTRDPLDLGANLMLDLQKGWRASPWLGLVHGEENGGWLYSPTLGWVFSRPDNAGVGVWFYVSGATTYLWTSARTYPVYWSPTAGTWVR